jgi:hypothetical protein
MFFPEIFDLPSHQANDFAHNFPAEICWGLPRKKVRHHDDWKHGDPPRFMGLHKKGFVEPGVWRLGALTGGTQEICWVVAL